MDQGKVKESVMLRSVLRPLGIKNNTYKGYSIGPENTIQALASFGSQADPCGFIAINQVCNELYALGAKPSDIFVSLSFVVGKDVEEQELKDAASILGKEIEKLGVNESAINARCENVSGINVSVVASSKAFEKNLPDAKDVLVVGKIGQAGLIRDFDSKIKSLTRLPKEMIEKASFFEDSLSVREYCEEIFLIDDEAFIYPIGEGGAFAGLWDFSNRVKAGFEVDPRLIPIDQATVEICEELDLNPYEMLSTGCAIILSDKADELEEVLTNKQIPIKKVGILTDNNDKILLLKDERRFLDKPKQDEVYK